MAGHTASAPPAAVVAAYALGPGSWRVIAPEGLNLSFDFTSDRGKRLHVKQIRSPPPAAALTASLRRSQELRSCGVPAPVIRTTRDGDLAAGDGDTAWIVSEWVKGRHADPVPVPAATAVGRICARLHRGLNPAMPGLRTWSWPDDWQEVTAGWHQLRAEVSRNSSLPTELAGHVRWLDQRKQDEEPSPKVSSELIGSIFGDLWLGQFLFTDDYAVAALLDWDDAGTEGVIAEELAGLLFRSFVTHNGSIPLAGAAGSFIRAYQAELPLAQAAWARVGQRMIAGGYRHLLHHIRAWQRGEPRTSVPVWRDRIIWRCQRLRWLIEHHAGVPETWVSSMARLLERQ